MKTPSNSLKLLLNLVTVESVLSRQFDGCLGSLGLTEFLLLYQLHTAPDKRLRRVDLAEKVGLTASGVTRMLAPMEKIGLVKREENAADARVSYVAIAKGGKAALKNALENAEALSVKLLSTLGEKQVVRTLAVLQKIGGQVA